MSFLYLFEFNASKKMSKLFEFDESNSDRQKNITQKKCER